MTLTLALFAGLGFGAGFGLVWSVFAVLESLVQVGGGYCEHPSPSIRTPAAIPDDTACRPQPNFWSS